MKFSKLKEEVDSRFDGSIKGNIDNRAQNLEVILNIVNTINKTLVLDEVLNLVLKSAISFTESERGFIVLVDDSNKLTYKLGLDDRGNKLNKDLFKVSMSVIEDVFRSGESRFIESAQNEGENGKSKSIFTLELQTILCSPLITGERKVGVIYVDSRQLKKINIKQITDTFEILAGQAAAAIRNAQLYQNQIQAYKALQESNKQLTIAKEEAEKSDKLKSEFLAQMSHEIRTPIHILMSYSSLIKEEVEDSLDEDLRSNFNAIEEAGKRIIRTTDLILNMAEVQTGTYDYQPTEFNLFEDIIEPILADFASSAKRKKINLVHSIETKNLILTADKYSVYQIFSNLIDNAIKYTEKGSVEIRIFNGSKKQLIVEVKDSGIGISKEYLPNLFKPFRQEQQGYKRQYEGNGLGLALTKSYCDLNNAAITLKSKKDAGSVFMVEFNSTQN